MTPALIIGPLLVAHALASTAEATLPHRHLHRGSITVDAVARPRADGTATGRLDVKMPGVSQSIELRPRWMSAQVLASSIRIVDVDFDGHPDLVVLRELGAKSSRTPERSEGAVANEGQRASDVYLFEPRTHRFSDASPLARELGRLPNLGVDAGHRHVTSYDIGPNRPSREVYDVTAGGLRLTESCAFLNDGEEHVGMLVRSRLAGGAMHSTYTRLRLGPSDLAPCGP